jgi:hypothetical protein
MAAQLIKENPKLEKKGSSRYTDLLFNKKSMKGGALSDATKDKIIKFLTDHAQVVNDLKKDFIMQLIEIMIDKGNKYNITDLYSFNSEILKIINMFKDRDLYDYDVKDIAKIFVDKNLNIEEDDILNETFAILVIMKNYYILSGNKKTKKLVQDIKFDILNKKLIDALTNYGLNDAKQKEFEDQFAEYKKNSGKDAADKVEGTPPPVPPPAPQPKKEIKLEISVILNIHIAAAIAAMEVIKDAVQAVPAPSPAPLAAPAVDVDADGEPLAAPAVDVDADAAKTVEDKAKAAAKAAVSEFVKNEQGKMGIIAENAEAYENLFTEETKNAEKGAVKAVKAGYAGLAAARADDATEKATDALANLANGEADAEADAEAAKAAEAVSEAAEAEKAATDQEARAALATSEQIDAAKVAVINAANNDYVTNKNQLLITAVVAAAAAALEIGDDDKKAVKQIIEKATQEAITNSSLKGGRNLPKYKSTGQVVFILYKKRKYKRTIYVKDKRKTKYCKINNEYILLSKMKIIE